MICQNLCRMFTKKLRKNKRRRNRCTVRCSKKIWCKTLPSGIHRWSIRRSSIRPPRLILYWNNTTAHIKPIQQFQSKCRLICISLPQNIWTSCDNLKMLKQLRTISFPRETDSINDQPCISRLRTSSLRKRWKCPWLVTCIRPLRSYWPDHS